MESIAKTLPKSSALVFSKTSSSLRPTSSQKSPRSVWILDRNNLSQNLSLSPDSGVSLMSKTMDPTRQPFFRGSVRVDNRHTGKNRPIRATVEDDVALIEPSKKDPGYPGFPDVIFYPGQAWGWDKPAPKTSLKDAEIRVDQSATAAPAILNLIEAIHWVSYLVGFYVTWIIFSNANILERSVDGSSFRVFLMILSLMTQVYGGGFGITMHEYEGWQISEFRNPLTTKFRLEDYNNALLRSVAYQLLFAFQSTGLLLFTLAVFGLNSYTVPLAIVSTFVAFVGPRNPRVQLYGLNHQPIFPVPVALLVTLIINALVATVAYPLFFGSALNQILGVPGILAVLAPLSVAAGGAAEGFFAESTFNQWHHFLSFVLLTFGLALIGGLFWCKSQV